MAEAYLVYPINTEENALIKSCEILKDRIHGNKHEVFNSEAVKDVGRKVRVRDDKIEEHHVELTRLWESVRDHNQKKCTEGEMDDFDHDSDEDDDEHDDNISSHQEKLKKVYKAIKLAEANVTSGMTHLRKTHKDVVFCPLAESSWHHPNFASTPLSFENMKIKLSHASEIVSFKEGSEEYVNIYFEKDSTYRIPIPSKGKQPQTNTNDWRHLSHIPDEDISGNNAILSDRKGFDANDCVARHFEKWGIEYGKNMMIFTDLNLPHQRFNCPDNFVCTNGDFDVLILSDEFVLFCQVKGVDEGTVDGTKKSMLHKAWSQSIKDRRHFCEATRDLPFISSIPIHRVIAVPNLNSEILETLGVCSYHRRFTLCKSDMRPFTRFVDWISAIVNPTWEHTAAARLKLPREHYQTLCARFVGVISKVEINTHQLSIQATDKVINPKSYVTVVPKNQLPNCRLFAILTPEQTELIDDDSSSKLKIILGEFGTGKSLVLLAKVLKLLEDTEVSSQPLMISLANIGNDGHCYHKTKFQAVHHLKEVIALPPTTRDSVVLSISDLIKEYRRSKGEPSEEVRTLVTPELFKGILSWKVKTTERVVHFFFDEVPSSFLQKCESVFREFPVNFPASRIWLAIAAHSSKPTQILHREYAEVIDRLTGTGHSNASLPRDSYVAKRLNRSMRVPRNVFRFVRFMQENEYPDFSSTICGHVVSGPKPLFFEVPMCKCNYPISVSADILKCHCSVQRLSVTLERTLTKCHLIGSAKPLHPSKCTILINVLLGSKLAKPLISLLAKACALLNVKLAFNVVVLLDEQTKAAVHDGGDRPVGIELNVFDQYTFMGCENAVIIGIDPYSLFQCGQGNHWTHSMNVFTRTTSLYVHVFWPNEDASKMWHSDLDAHDNLTAAREYLTEDEKRARFEFTARGRASSGDLVEKLIDTDCVIKIPVLYMDENSNRLADTGHSNDFLQHMNNFTI